MERTSRILKNQVSKGVRCEEKWGITLASCFALLAQKAPLVRINCEEAVWEESLDRVRSSSTQHRDELFEIK